MSSLNGRLGVNAAERLVQEYSVCTSEKLKYSSVAFTIEIQELADRIFATVQPYTDVVHPSLCSYLTFHLTSAFWPNVFHP